MENQLIQLYLLVCQIYDNQSSLKSQRLSNFKPRFTDQELVAVYLFGHLNGLFSKKAIYRFTRNYWADWFPQLPSYQAFCNRLNNLESSFQIINCELLKRLTADQSTEVDHLIDSYPVMLAKGAFARRASVAREFAALGYCAAKRLHFYGVRLHLIAQRRSGRLPLPSEIWFRAGNVHDLTAFKEQDIRLPDSTSLRRQGVLRRSVEKTTQRTKYRTSRAGKEAERQRTNRIRQKLFAASQPLSPAD